VSDGLSGRLPAAPLQQAIALSDSSQVGEARRLAGYAGYRAGLSEPDCARAAVIATELATNAIRHAKGGELLIRTQADPARKAVELIALDRGPGMADTAHCMADGYSTAGSLGHGLGAISRLSSSMDIYSVPGRGTAVYSRVEAAQRRTQSSPEDTEQCAISVAAPGETECGDNCRVARSDGFVAVVVADGLGHGPLAARPANEAVEVFEKSPFQAPESYLTKAHEALHGTRGAAVACVRVDLGSRTLLYVGVGNISASIVDHDTLKEKSLPSHNGIVGVQMGRVQQFEYPVLEGDLLVMHSDGLTSRWKLADYPGLACRAPALVAAVLYRDFKRSRDDATVVVVRLR